MRWEEVENRSALAMSEAQALGIRCCSRAFHLLVQIGGVRLPALARGTYGSPRKHHFLRLMRLTGCD